MKLHKRVFSELETDSKSFTMCKRVKRRTFDSFDIHFTQLVDQSCKFSLLSDCGEMRTIVYPQQFQSKNLLLYFFSRRVCCIDQKDEFVDKCLTRLQSWSPILSKRLDCQVCAVCTDSPFAIHATMMKFTQQSNMMILSDMTHTICSQFGAYDQQTGSVVNKLVMISEGRAVLHSKNVGIHLEITDQLMNELVTGIEEMLE